MVLRLKCTEPGAYIFLELCFVIKLPSILIKTLYHLQLCKHLMEQSDILQLWESVGEVVDHHLNAIYLQLSKSYTILVSILSFVNYFIYALWGLFVFQLLDIVGCQVMNRLICIIFVEELRNIWLLLISVMVKLIFCMVNQPFTIHYWVWQTSTISFIDFANYE